MAHFFLLIKTPQQKSKNGLSIKDVKSMPALIMVRLEDGMLIGVIYIFHGPKINIIDPSANISGYFAEILEKANSCAAKCLFGLLALGFSKIRWVQVVFF
jgi:hypothetical protein